MGEFKCPAFRYSGSFSHNGFDGRGKEEGETYVFEGEFLKGRRNYGKLTWKDCEGFVYFYSGSFNENNRFHGKGFPSITKAPWLTTEALTKASSWTVLRRAKVTIRAQTE